jgi:hypothetical protein
MTANGLTLPHVAWGNGAAGSGAGPAAEVGCASCHNPHGNGQYRILNVLRENATIPETWTVAIGVSSSVNVDVVPEVPPATLVNELLANNLNTVTSHGLLVGDKIVIAGHTGSTPDLNGTWYVKTAASNNFSITATLNGPVQAITAGGSGGTVSRTSGVPVTDATLPTAGDARNYTVMQVKGSGTEGTPASEATYMLYASQVLAAAGSNSFNSIPGTYSATGGDYFARAVPWNPDVNGVCDPTIYDTDPVTPGNQAQAGCATANSAPNGRPSTFSGQITQWCASCHTRYFANSNAVSLPATGQTGASWQYPRPNDSLFNHQHRTVAGRDCLTCHVSHGSNAAMTGTFSASFPYPNGTTSGNSRLLKVDNRGTCQACHDPTGTVAAGTILPVGSTPVVP